jgi:hypothetical protein
MRRDFQSIVRDKAAGIPGDGPNPGASVRNRYASIIVTLGVGKRIMSNAIDFFKSITKNTILGQIIIGVILLLISAAGNLSIGDFHYTLSSAFWTWVLFVVGVILVVVALIVQVIQLFSKEEIYKERVSGAQKHIVLSDQARNSLSEALGTERISSLLRQRINYEEKARAQLAIADLSERIHVQRIALSNLEQVVKGVIVVSSIEEDITKEDIPDLLSKAFGALLEATISIPLHEPRPSQD